MPAHAGVCACTYIGRFDEESCALLVCKSAIGRRGAHAADAPTIAVSRGTEGVLQWCPSRHMVCCAACWFSGSVSCVADEGDVRT